MTCFSPVHAWYSPNIKTKDGKKKLVFQKDKKFNIPINVPCGQCIGCRLEQSRQWAVRVSLENQMHDKSIFCTLTYDDEHIPYIVNPDTGEMLQTLKPIHFTNFIKTLRRQIEYHYPDNGLIRFFGCGEYGSKTERPHFHIIIFGFEPPDKRLYRTTFNGNKLYNSDFLEKCWKYGFINFGSVTFESAAYVARYVTKKITGEMADEHYQGRCPEFVRMSRRPGIGKKWLEKFKGDVYPQDFIVIRDGVKCRPPRYFDKIFEQWFPDQMENIKLLRSENAADLVHNDLAIRSSDSYMSEKIKFSDRILEKDFLKDLESYFYEYEVLPVKEEVQKAKFKQLKRSLEGDVF